MNDILYYLDNFYKYTPIPVVAVRETVVIYQNPVAEKLFGRDFLGYYATKHFRGYPYPAGATVSVSILGYERTVSVASMDDVDIFTITDVEEDVAITSIPVRELSSMNTYVSTLFIATEKLAELCVDNEKNELYTSVLFQNFYKLLNITEMLTTISRLEASQYPINFKFIELGNFFTDIAAAVVAMTDGTNINFEYTRPKELISIRGDSDLIERMVLALISNSIRNTPSGGSIVLTLSRLRSDVVITVTDNGCGIPTEKIPSIFELNHVIHKDTGIQYEGGLGLPFVAQVVSAHDGAVVLNSHVGIGTTVAISLKSQMPTHLVLKSPLPFETSVITSTILTALASSLPRGQYTKKKIFDR